MKSDLTALGSYAGAKGAIAETYKKQVVAEQKGYFQVAAHIYSWLGPANYIAYSYALEAIDLLDDRGLLKLNAKKIANSVTSAYYSYKRRALAKSERGRDDELDLKSLTMLWDNLCERIYRRIDEHINILYWSVNSCLKRMNTDGDIELYSKMFVAHMLFDLAFQRFKTYFVVMGDSYANGHNFEDLFTEFDPSPMHSWWTKLEDIFIPDDIVPDFNKDENTHRAFDIIAMKLNDPIILNQSASEALEYDPVFAEKSKRIREDWLNEQKDIIRQKEAQ